MNIFKALFAAPEAAKKMADGIYNGLDAAVFTSQEQANMRLKFLQAYEPYKLAQRLIALTLTVPFVVIAIMSALVFVASLFFDPCLAAVACKSEQLASGAWRLAEWNAKTFGVSVAIFVWFYFKGGADREKNNGS